MLAKAPIVLLYANSFYSFDTLMPCLTLYSAKNVEILRNKHGIFVPNIASILNRGKKNNFDLLQGSCCESRNQQNNNKICYFWQASYKHLIVPLLFVYKSLSKI